MARQVGIDGPEPSVYLTTRDSDGTEVVLAIGVAQWRMTKREAARLAAQLVYHTGGVNMEVKESEVVFTINTDSDLFRNLVQTFNPFGDFS